MHGNVDSKSQDFPLDHSGGFLGLSDDDLFQKCLIITTRNVVSSADQGDFEKTRQVFRTTHFDGTHRSTWSAVLLDEPHAYESPATGDTPNICSATTVTPGTTSDDYSSHTLPDNQSQNPDEVTPPNDLDHRAYEESGLAARRHAKQAVVLIVGPSSYSKSKTINRLVGRNLLEMGKSTTGSTTKVTLFRLKMYCGNYIHLFHR